MTWLDKYLQQQRIGKALAYIPEKATVLDIGCHKGELLLMIRNQISLGIGIDPLCEPSKLASNIQLLKGLFPAVLEANQKFDCITALAVLEHITLEEQPMFMRACHGHLNDDGKLIVTVPDAKVDSILAVLTRLKLVKGMSLEEHFGFDAKSTPNLALQAGLRLVAHKRFQFGLNNLFVFTKSLMPK